jgi:hypothetical protein
MMPAMGNQSAKSPGAAGAQTQASAQLASGTKFKAGQTVLAWDSHQRSHVAVVLIKWKPYRGMAGWDVGSPINGWCDEQRMQQPNEKS